MQLPEIKSFFMRPFFFFLLETYSFSLLLYYQKKMNTTNIKKSTSVPNEPLFELWSDELMAIWVPIVVYWVQCSFFEVLMRLEIPFLEQYRIHTPDDRNKRNKVSFGKVLLMVALQHVVQIVLGIALMKGVDPVSDQHKHDQAIHQYTTILLQTLTSFGQQQDKAFVLANSGAIFIQNFIVPCIQFFIAM
jgi:sphinganine C4-monooxygenase